MNDRDNFHALFRAPAAAAPDDGFTARVMRRIRHRARRRRAVLVAAALLGVLAASMAAWVFPARALALDAWGMAQVLLLVAASGLVTLGTETSAPRGTPVSPC